MKKLFSVLKYCKYYKTSTVLNIIFNILYALFSVATLAFIIPFLDLLFNKESSSYQEIINQGPPSFSFKASYLQGLSTFHLSDLIYTYGKSDTLIIICIAVFIITFFKNISR